MVRVEVGSDDEGDERERDSIRFLFFLFFFSFSSFPTQGNYFSGKFF